MSERHDPHPADATVGEHGQPSDHGGDHGHDDHGHEAETLGPIDVKLWAAGLVGVALGLVVALALLQAVI